MFRSNLLVLLGIFGLTNLSPVTAQTVSTQTIKFNCVQDGDLPTTVALNVETNQSLPIIRWQSQYFANSGYDNFTRCQQVSARFQTHYDQNKLNYITAGVVNNSTVICATEEKGSCNSDNILFTLEPNQDAAATLQQLFDVRHYSAGPLLRGGQPSYPYINMQEMLQPLNESKPPTNPEISEPSGGQQELQPDSSEPN